MEFIMTYGWAILAVSIAISALVYFGVFSPPSFGLEQCSFPAELTCIGKPLPDATTGELTFVVTNSVGSTMSIDDITGAGDCDSPLGFTVDGDATVPQNITHGDQARIMIDCGTIDEGPFSAQITIEYTNLFNALSYPATGSIQANAQ